MSRQIFANSTVRRRRKMISAERAAYNSFVNHFRAYEFDIDIETVLKKFRTRFHRPVIRDWQEVSRALIWNACIELKRVKRTLFPGSARRLISEKYNGVPIGISCDGRVIALHLSPTSLWRQERKGAHLAGGSPDAYTKTFPGSKKSA
jgi:hypothetical protein